MGTTSLALTEAVYYILLSVLTPLHGYAIMQNIEKLSEGRVKLAAGTLYGAISSMQEKGWIQAMPDDGERKKAYQITEAGRTLLWGELERLEELLRNGKRLLGGDSDA